MTPSPTSGLDGVFVADTRLSLVDGVHGRLVVGGLPVAELARATDFEGACHLLWTGALPEANGTDLALGEARVRAHDVLAGTPTPTEGPPIARMAALLAHAGEPPAAPLEAAAWAAASVAVAVGRVARALADAAPLAPDPTLGHAADVLRLVTGTAPDAARAEALDTYLVTVAEHGMNASTFAARVVASTQSDLLSCVLAAVGALRGPLHGGAPGPVLDMLDAVGSPDRAEAWVRSELDRGQRIMGMGHRVYRQRDPRMDVLEGVLDRLAAAGAGTHRIALARAVETAALTELHRRHPDRPLCANVEFGTALLLEALDVPRSLFTPMFAVARVAGWCAHVGEQRESGRLIRPRARYVGPLPAGV